MGYFDIGVCGVGTIRENISSEVQIPGKLWENGFLLFRHCSRTCRELIKSQYFSFTNNIAIQAFIQLKLAKVLIQMGYVTSTLLLIIYTQMTSRVVPSRRNY